MKLSGFCKDSSMGAKLTILVLLIIWGALAAIIPMFFIQGDDALLTSVYLQNIVMFIIPAWVTAFLIWGKPGKSLRLNRVPRLMDLICVAVLLLVAMPMLNRLVEWNEAMHLPEALKSVEQWMRQQEEAATAVTNSLLQVDSLSSFLLVILGVGVLTGMGEEFVFRGALQQIFQGRSRRTHIAIWLSAFLFSAIHLQFFGFFPRLLLGALFGYLLVWCENLWIPIFAHALNNSIVVCSAYWGDTFYPLHKIETIGTLQSGTEWIAWGSAVATLLLLWTFKRCIFGKKD